MQPENEEPVQPFPQQPQPANNEQPFQNPPPQADHIFWFLPRSNFIRYTIIIGIPILVALLFSTFTLSLLTINKQKMSESNNQSLFFYRTSQTFRNFMPETLVSNKFLDLSFAILGISLSRSYKYAILTLNDFSTFQIGSTGFFQDPYDLFESQIQKFAHALGIISLDIEDFTQTAVVMWLPESLDMLTKNSYHGHYNLLAASFPGLCIMTISQKEHLKVEFVLKLCADELNLKNQYSSVASYKDDQDSGRMLREDDEFSGGSRVMEYSLRNYKDDQNKTRMLEEDEFSGPRIIDFWLKNSRDGQESARLVKENELYGTRIMEEKLRNEKEDEFSGVRIMNERLRSLLIENNLSQENGQNMTNTGQGEGKNVPEEILGVIDERILKEILDNLNKFRERWYKYALVEFSGGDYTRINVTIERNRKFNYHKFIEIQSQRPDEFAIIFYHFAYEANFKPVLIIWRPELLACSPEITEPLLVLIHKIHEAEPAIPIVIAKDTRGLRMMHIARVALTDFSLPNNSMTENQGTVVLGKLKEVWWSDVGNSTSDGIS